MQEVIQHSYIVGVDALLLTWALIFAPSLYVSRSEANCSENVHFCVASSEPLLLAVKYKIWNDVWQINLELKEMNRLHQAWNRALHAS